MTVKRTIKAVVSIYNIREEFLSFLQKKSLLQTIENDQNKSKFARVGEFCLLLAKITTAYPRTFSSLVISDSIGKLYNEIIISFLMDLQEKTSHKLILE